MASLLTSCAIAISTAIAITYYQARDDDYEQRYLELAQKSAFANDRLCDAISEKATPSTINSLNIEYERLEHLKNTLRR